MEIKAMNDVNDMNVSILKEKFTPVNHLVS